jgi:uncharacterized lipoprotein YddW (UPF0748 family)
MNRISSILATVLLLPAMLFAADDSNSADKIVPPPPVREFRAAWIATVGNSCWPSKPGLTTTQQKAELIALLDRAVALKLNAVIFQVRPASDALYASSFEPWSEYLTGVQGRAPSPYYDPLDFAIAEAHKRGLELHAWFNPFRAHHFQSVSPIAPNHISHTQPQLVRSYGRYLWLDPGDPAVREYSLRVVMDVVKRYDVDGIHFDDYFYPYREKNSAGMEIDFPDGATWKQYGMNSGLSRDDWRRQNVDIFIQQVYYAIKAEKPWVKFGISPFGIWRPKNPPAISGFDSYAGLYADSRKWLREGWCDYLAPQLYWGIAPPQTSFTTLLDWWNSENVHHRHIWPGMNSLKVGEGWQPSEIVSEIKATRWFPDDGQVHWNISALMNNAALDTALQHDAYQQPALIPASPWLDAIPPAKPKLNVTPWNKTVTMSWVNGGAKPARWWVLQCRTNGVWTTEIFPADQSGRFRENFPPDAIAIRAADRTGNLSEPAVWTPEKYAPAGARRGMNN